MHKQPLTLAQLSSAFYSKSRNKRGLRGEYDLHLFIYRTGDGLIENELLLGNLMSFYGFSLTLKGKEIIPSSVDLSSLAPHVSLISSPLQLYWGQLPYVICIIFFSAQLILFDRSFKEGQQSLCVSWFLSSWHLFLSLPSSGMDRTAWTQNALPWNTHNALVDALLCLDYRCWPAVGH